MRSWLAILLITFGNQIASAQVHPSDADCPDAFRNLFATLKPHTGDIVSDARFPDATTSFLGQGFGGGNVYLVRPKDGSAPFVVKDYVLGGADSAINDAFGLEVLDKLTEGRVTQKAMRPVRVIERLDRDSFKLEYIPGRDVRKLADEAEDEEARTKLARLFERQLETLKNNLPNGRDLQVGNHGFTVMEASYRGSVTRGFQDLVVVLRRKEFPRDLVHLWIKPENVVVTPDGEFVIIDPR
ncbi:MAG: hypothetical protein U1E10_08095 [Bdellovibrionales bacterium]|nr:hypothetical protein [Bdellovibrionales bacterium]